MATIYKTKITYTVLHEKPGAPQEMPIENVLHECVHGEFIGQTTEITEEAVPSERVQSELIAIGNDGTFFADATSD